MTVIPSANLAGHPMWRVSWRAFSGDVYAWDFYAASEGDAEAYVIRKLWDVPDLVIVNVEPSPRRPRKHKL